MKAISSNYLQVVNKQKENMTPEQFVYWLQGFCEMQEGKISDRQWEMVKDHLKEVFTKKTPEYSVSTYDKLSGIKNSGTKFFYPRPEADKTPMLIC